MHRRHQEGIKVPFKYGGTLLLELKKPEVCQMKGRSNVSKDGEAKDVGLIKNRNRKGTAISKAKNKID